MKKIFNFMLFLGLLLFFPIIAKANSIDKIDMDIYIDKSGTAHVTEVWSANLNEGTEGYKPYYNLGEAKITNFKVSEDNKEYTFNNSWNTKESFSNKAYKNGINHVKNGLELCWGISKYGYHNYKLTYDIEGFAVKLKDSDMVYWQLIPYELSQKPDNVHIKIYSDDKYSNGLPVWGYGKYGAPTRVHNGYIEMNSKGTLNTNEYMTILIKFDKGTFNTYNSLNNSFNYYLNMANKNAKVYKQSSNIFYRLFQLFKEDYRKSIEFIMSIIGIALLFIAPRFSETRLRITDERLYFGKNGKIIKGNIPYVREIPFNADIYRAYWVTLYYNINDKISDFFGAILLKMILENKVKIISEKNKTILDLSLKPTFDNDLERELFGLLYEASHDGVLEPGEFKEWCKDFFEEIIKSFNKAMALEKKKLIMEGRIKIVEKKVGDAIYFSYIVDPSMKNDAIKIKGLQNFLKDFSKISDKEAIEVGMWEQYLIYGKMLGVANKVTKQFKKMYPNIVRKGVCNYNLDDIKFVNMFSHSSFKGINMSRGVYPLMDDNMPNNNISSSSSNGFSSGGGGGGSFGGGGGGGGFR